LFFHGLRFSLFLKWPKLKFLSVSKQKKATFYAKKPLFLEQSFGLIASTAKSHFEWKLSLSHWPPVWSGAHYRPIDVQRLLIGGATAWGVPVRGGFNYRMPARFAHCRLVYSAFGRKPANAA
jgi:hypothetical protein